MVDWIGFNLLFHFLQVGFLALKGTGGGLPVFT
jgi:hypothetical protein